MVRSSDGGESELNSEKKRKMTTHVENADRAMEPWEQHHAIISMPRFAYNAISILETGNVGFLITCTFRREKSATKEALALLREFMKVKETGKIGTPTSSTANLREEISPNVELASKVDVKALSHAIPATSEEPKCEVTLDGEVTVSSETEYVAPQRKINNNDTKEDVTRANVVTTTGEEEKSENVNALEASSEDTHSETGHEFMLVKLATMGVIYISASKESSKSVLSIVSRIVRDVQARSRPPPQWCHRMLPVQATCSTKREEVQAVVARLVRDYLDNTSLSAEEPIDGDSFARKFSKRQPPIQATQRKLKLINSQYAVAFNKRGADGVKSDRKQADNFTQETAFDRGECIKVVTAAVHQVTSNVKVNLTSPQMVIFMELIPVAGARSSLICAVSVVSGDLIISKPKLMMKPLAPQSKKRKHH